MKPVVVVGKKGKPNSSKTTTTPNGHSARNVGGVDHFAGERERRFLEFWGTFRSERGMSPESLTEDQLPALMELLDQAEHQWPHDSDLALSYLVTDFLRDTTLNRPTLTTLLKPSVWPARLDAACSRAKDHAERAVERARKRNRGL